MPSGSRGRRPQPTSPPPHPMTSSPTPPSPMPPGSSRGGGVGRRRRPRLDDQGQPFSPPPMPSGSSRRPQPTSPPPHPMPSSPTPPSPMPPGSSRRPQPSPATPPPPMPPESSWFTLNLITNSLTIQIHAYEDKDGVLFTLHGGQIRPVADVYTEITSNFSLGNQDTGGAEEVKSREEHDKYVEDLLNKAVADLKLQMSKPSEDTEQAVKKTLSSSMPQAQASEDTDQAVNLGTIKASSPSSHNSPPIYSLNPKRLNFGYFVRADIGGSFHTYPSLTGPFQSLKDVQKAINSLHAEQSKMMCMKGLSEMEMAIRGALYWHNGLRKNSAEAITFMKNLRPKTNMVRALLDKYNEDSNLSGDLVYELIKIVHSESIHERNGNPIRLYYHFNLIIRTKGADGRSNNLFFAEVACKEGKYEEFVLTFLRMLQPDDNGKCIECDVDMKHPSDVEYKRGRAKIPLPCMVPQEVDRAYMEELAAVYDEAQLKAQEARVRKEFKELYDQSRARFQKKYVVPAMRQENKGGASVRITA